MKTQPCENVDRYIAQFDDLIKQRLVAIRKVIYAYAPDAEEGIFYGMPGYKLNKRPLVYFAGFKKHVGFYATPTGHKEFQAELANYKQGKGSVQFPHKEALPIDLIERMVRYRVEENLGS
jgi:uncharacterized protein YdhG (YjbR/CyaY superfamily)